MEGVTVVQRTKELEDQQAKSAVLFQPPPPPSPHVFSLQGLIHDLPSDVDLSKSPHGNPNYFLTYGNGKPGGNLEMQAQMHLRPNGAHGWHHYMKVPKEVKLMEAAVLHFTYTHFSDLTSRRDRCGCKPNSEDVKKCFMLDFDRLVRALSVVWVFWLTYACLSCSGCKPNSEDVKKCFMLGFDRLAFIIASTQTEEQMWFLQTHKSTLPSLPLSLSPPMQAFIIASTQTEEQMFQW
ncbi:unnamed protein product [Closterium sp. NIES-64]|nr:unnamed protein product [Closterium sp. NIES-64]